MKDFLFLKTLLLFLFIGFCIQNLFAQENRFTKEVAELEVKYSDLQKYKGGIVFTGSSSIRMWKTLEKDFLKSIIVNTGFGGSETSDVLEFLDALVMKFEPKKIFIYVGENDINADKSVRQVMGEYAVLMERISKKLPEAEFYFIGIKPSPSRWEKRGQMMALNEEIRIMSKSKNNVTYIDIWTKMLDKNGQPNKDLFVEDMLHMNAKGYKIWQKVVKQYVE